MRKLLIIIGLLLLMLVPLLAPAASLMMVGGGVKAAAPTGQSFSDNFNTSDSLAGWTQSYGTFSETTGVLRSTTTFENIEIIYSTATDTTSQVMEFLWSFESTGSKYFNIFLRAQGTATTSDMIVLEWDMGGAVITISRATGLAGAGWTSIGSNATSVTPASGHYYGITVTGASNSINVAIYDNNTSSNWANRASWSSPIASWTGADASAVTLGNYFGLGWYDPESSIILIDNWQGGDL